MIPEINDIHPKTWLKPFEKNGVFYLLKMALFYHALSLAFMYVGSFLATTTMPDYEAPQFPVSISLALSAGLLEESIFFGIPYYLTGNPVVLLGSGIVWSISHLFSSGTFSIHTLAYGGFLLTIPHIFFSIRTWISGKGWFAILFHSLWNVGALSTYCAIGLRQCSIFSDVLDILNIIMAASAGTIVYMAYKNKENRINRFLYLGPVAVIIIVSVVVFVSGDYFVFETS